MRCSLISRESKKQNSTVCYHTLHKLLQLFVVYASTTSPHPTHIQWTLHHGFLPNQQRAQPALHALHPITHLCLFIFATHDALRELLEARVGTGKQDVLDERDPDHTQRQSHHQHHLIILQQLALRSRSERKGHGASVDDVQHRNLNVTQTET